MACNLSLIVLCSYGHSKCMHCNYMVRKICNFISKNFEKVMQIIMSNMELLQ